MNRMQTSIARATISLLLLVPLAGCFESLTSEASSKSSSRVSSSCSPSDDDKSAYNRDIRDYTATYVATGGDIERYQRDLARIAEGFGVTNWESDRKTHLAIGRGVATAGMNEAGMEDFALALAHGDSERAHWVEQGYLTPPCP